MAKLTIYNNFNRFINSKNTQTNKEYHLCSRIDLSITWFTILPHCRTFQERCQH